MAYHLIFVFVQAATLAAFMIMWRMWIRKKLTASFLIEDEDRITFPFKYFSWVLLAVFLVTSVAQTHYVWTSHNFEKNASALKNVYQMAEKHGQHIEETKMIVEKLARELELNTKAVKLFSKDLPSLVRSSKMTNDLKVAPNEAAPKPTQLRASLNTGSFDKEAKASSKERVLPDAKNRSDSESVGEESDSVHSMRLNRRGSVVGNGLRVRKSPDETSDVVETLNAGKLVKVTEKRFQKDRVWFRIITPTGRAGWVDFNFVKLDGNA
ncbi:MAG: SH3 domain-containing protein [Desulfomonilaceae bacterium]